MDATLLRYQMLLKKKEVKTKSHFLPLYYYMSICAHRSHMSTQYIKVYLL